jgi:hypothetical protein
MADPGKNSSGYQVVDVLHAPELDQTAQGYYQAGYQHAKAGQFHDKG